MLSFKNRFGYRLYTSFLGGVKMPYLPNHIFSYEYRAVIRFR